MPIRTDLAAESVAAFGKNKLPDGINHTTEKSGGLEISRTQIRSKTASEELSKPIGSYVTLSSLGFSLESSPEEFEERARALANELRTLCGEFSSVLAVGLGNRFITPDAVGPLVCDKLLATRHIHRLAKEIATEGLGVLSAFAPGVMGQTGIESAEAVKALADCIKPDVIIVVDALACCEGENLAKTIQLCDSGISPGSGVGNSRAEFSQRSMGRRVVAIGVPTVIDADILCNGDTVYNGMFVTPRNIDSLVERMSGLISMGINLAVHPSLSVGEIASLI